MSDKREVTSLSALLLYGLLIRGPLPAIHSETADHVVFVQNGELFGRIGDGSPERLATAGHFETATVSARKCHVLLRSDGRRSWLTLLDCDSSGNLLRVRTVVDERLTPATAVMDASIHADGRCFALLHVNPSTDLGVLIGPNASDRTIFSGNTFTWTASGRHIAYFIEQYDASNNQTLEVWIDGHKACEAGCDDGDLSWNAAGTQLTVTLSTNGKAPSIRTFKAE